MARFNILNKTKNNCIGLEQKLCFVSTSTTQVHPVKKEENALQIELKTNEVYKAEDLYRSWNSRKVWFVVMKSQGVDDVL